MRKKQNFFFLKKNMGREAANLLYQKLLQNVSEQSDNIVLSNLGFRVLVLDLYLQCKKHNLIMQSIAWVESRKTGPRVDWHIGHQSLLSSKTLKNFLIFIFLTQSYRELFGLGHKNSDLKLLTHLMMFFFLTSQRNGSYL